MNPKTGNMKFQLIRPTTNRLSLNIGYVGFSIYSILYTIFVITIFELTIFPTINRITYTETVQWSITSSLEFDLLISSIFFAIGTLVVFKKNISLPFTGIVLGFSFLNIFNPDYFLDFGLVVFIVSMPVIIAITVLSKFSLLRSNGKIIQSDETQKNFEFQNFLKILFLVFVIFESIALIRWLIYPLIPEILPSHWSWQINLLDTNFFYSFGLLSPILLILSMLFFIIKPTITHLYKRFSHFSKNNNEHTLDTSTSQSKKDPKDYLSSNSSQKLIKNKDFSIFDSNFKSFLLVVLIAVIPSILISIYPYTVAEPQVFEGPSLPGVLGYDFSAYSEAIDLLISSTSSADSFLNGLFVEINNGSRPLTIFSIYLLYLVSGQPVDEVLTYLPSIIGPFLVLSIYFFVRTAYPEDRRIAVIASIMTAVSHQIVVGFYAGLYANWMGLAVMLVSAIFLIKCFQSTNHLSRNITLFAVFTILIMLYHNFLWAYFILVLVFLLAWSALQRIRAKKSLRVIALLSIVIAGIVAVDVLKSEFTEASSGFENDFSVATLHTDVTESQNLWENLDKAFKTYLGGFLTNSVVLLLLFLWTLKADYSKISDKFLLSMLFVALVPVLFGDFLVQSRLVYIIPIQIPASILMWKIYKNPKISFGKPLFFAILLMQFNYALRSMANMNFVLPE